MNSEWFTTDQVRQLVDLLTVVAAAPAFAQQSSTGQSSGGPAVSSSRPGPEIGTGEG